MSAVVPSVIRLASRVRGERVIHAKGRAFTGVLRVDGAAVGVPLLDVPGDHRLLLRFSRGAGLPDALPDALGLAVRVLDAHGDGRHQDLLLTTGARQPVLRHAIVPRRDLLASTYTSLVPYRLAGRPWLLAALPVGGHATSVDALRPEQIAFDLAVASTRGPWKTWARLTATALAQDGLTIDFDPAVTGGGIESPLRALRGGAYRAAQAEE